MTAGKSYSNRVKHDLLKLWPNFSDGPIGRMDYFKGFLGVGLLQVALGFLGALAFDDDGARYPEMVALTTIVAIVGLAGFGVTAVHWIALTYKRFWDMGFDDRGTRILVTIGNLLLIGLTAFLWGVLVLIALCLIPRKVKNKS